MFHIIHNWSKWEDIPTNTTIAVYNRWKGRFENKNQQSVCTACGKKKLREIKS